MFLLHEKKHPFQNFLLLLGGCCYSEGALYYDLLTFKSLNNFFLYFSITTRNTEHSERRRLWVCIEQTEFTWSRWHVWDQQQAVTEKQSQASTWNKWEFSHKESNIQEIDKKSYSQMKKEATTIGHSRLDGLCRLVVKLMPTNCQFFVF